MDYERKIAEAGLEIKAIKLNPDNPFEWASGFFMPIYNDNRVFLFYPKHRRLITNALKFTAKKIDFQVIAGTSTAGISPATSLADTYDDCPLIYVRDKPKNHGLKNQIEGIDSNSNLEGRLVLLIEDLISTGGSSVKAVQAIRNANGKCNDCISVFNYGFEISGKMFLGKEPFNKEGECLESPCNVHSLLSYDVLINIAKEKNYFNKSQLEKLEDWKKDPFNWGEKNGFPRTKK